MGEDKDLHPSEERAFAYGHALAKRLIDQEGLNPIYTGTAFLMVAVATLSEHMPRTEIAEILQNYADDCDRS